MGRTGRAAVAPLLVLLVLLTGCVPSGGVLQRDDPVLPGAVDEDLAGAVATVEEYWAGVFARQGTSFTPVTRVFGYRRGTTDDCAGQQLVPNNALYCPPGDFIAYDADWVTAAWEQVGDAFVYYLVGHEYAHAIQGPFRLGIEHRFTINHELQADCMAGAYLGDMVRADRLTLEEGDVDELVDGLAAVADPEGSPWFAPGAHGTVRERTDAFSQGFNRSLAACDL